MKKKIFFLFSAFMLIILSACSGSDDASNENSNSDEEAGTIDKIIFGDAGWDSLSLNNDIARILIEDGYGYETDATVAAEPAIVQGLRSGEIHVYMEFWTKNIEDAFNESIDSGDVIAASEIFETNEQGLYVPTYVIEGDEERGIEPVAPDLSNVEDLKKYPEVFLDPSDSSKGRILTAPTDWEISEDYEVLFEEMGLNEMYNSMKPGSQAALTASLHNAYTKGEPWVGNFWGPTMVSANYDLTLLELDEEYHDIIITSQPVMVGIHKDLPEQAPDVAEFLQKYDMSTADIEAALRYINEHDETTENTARWWVEEHVDVWSEWVTEEAAEKIKENM